MVGGPGSSGVAKNLQRSKVVTIPLVFDKSKMPPSSLGSPRLESVTQVVCSHTRKK